MSEERSSVAVESERTTATMGCATRFSGEGMVAFRIESSVRCALPPATRTTEETSLPSILKPSRRGEPVESWSRATNAAPCSVLMSFDPLLNPTPMGAPSTGGRVHVAQSYPPRTLIAPLTTSAGSGYSPMHTAILRGAVGC